MLPSLPKVLLTLGLNLISGGVLGTLAQQVHESGKDVIESATDELGDKIKESIEEKIENHEADKNTLQAFKHELAQLAEELDKPLVFIIDELDRCRPDFAIRLIERIKHFFDILKIVFVLVMDKTQFSTVICHNYGYDEQSGEEYLDKFVDFIIPLPQISVPSFSNRYDHVKTLKKLLSKVGEESDDICLVFYLAQFNNYFPARQLKKTIHKYALLKKASAETNIFLVIALLLNPEKLTEKVIKTVGVLHGVSINQDMSGFVTNIARLDLEQLQIFVREHLKLNAEVYFELIKRIKSIEISNLAVDGRSKEYIDLFSTFTLQRISKHHNEISDQFKLYLNAQLWDKDNDDSSQ